MLTSVMHERIKWFRKDYVHNQYTRIVQPFKEYEKITKVKMLDEIYKLYEDYNNIIDICTVRELKYLKKILDKKISNIELDDKKYEWEKSTLRNKFLIQYDDKIFVPDEIVDKVKEALKNIDWEEAKKKDEINEVLVSYCKIQASALMNTVISIGSALTGMKEEDIHNHMICNRVFKYYVILYLDNIASLGNDIPIALYQDYYSISDQINEERRKQGLAGNIQINKERFKTLFYNDFDINNKKIKVFLEETKKYLIFQFWALDLVREYAVLNIDRQPLKDNIASVPALKDTDLTNLFQLMDDAMDEMPSGALNGLTPNEAKRARLEKEKTIINKEKEYIRQHNACLSKEDAKLFYKVYFGLLDFTNNKYKIKPKLKLYNRLGINPYEISEIVESFWNDKDKLVSEFCLANPFRFNKDELEVTKEFKKGIRNVYIIAKFYEEYTAIMSQDKTYMIKGINDNLDNIISYKELPKPFITTIVPFKGTLIYDGLLLELGIDMGLGFEKIVLKELETSIKYYYL